MRGFNANEAGGMGDIAFDTPDVLAALVSSGGASRHSSTYADFTAALELSHAAAHIGIGAALLRRPDISGVGPNVGDMYYMSRAAADPVFFSLHAAVDRYWMARQHAYPATRNEFGGTQQGIRVRPSDVLTPFDRTAGDTFGLPCVAYARPPRPPPAPRGRSARGRGRGRGRERGHGRGRLSPLDTDAAVRHGRAPRNRLLADYLAANGRSAGEIERAEVALDDAAVDAVTAPPGANGGVVDIALGGSRIPTTAPPTGTSTAVTETVAPATPVTADGWAVGGGAAPRLTPATTRPPVLPPVTTRRPAAPVAPWPVPSSPLVTIVTGPPVGPRRPLAAPTASATPRPPPAATAQPAATRRPAVARRPIATWRSAAPPVETRRPEATAPPVATRRPVTPAAAEWGGRPRSAGRDA